MVYYIALCLLLFNLCLLKISCYDLENRWRVNNNNKFEFTKFFYSCFKNYNNSLIEYNKTELIFNNIIIEYFQRFLFYLRFNKLVFICSLFFYENPSGFINFLRIIFSCIIFLFFHLNLDFLYSFFINYQFEYEEFITNINRGWGGYPSAGPSNDPNLGNSSFGGNPGPGGSGGGNRPPTTELAISEQSGNRDNHRDQRNWNTFSNYASRNYPTNQNVRPEMVFLPTNDPSTIHISDLKAQQDLADRYPDPAISGHRPYNESHSPLFGSYPEEWNFLNRNTYYNDSFRFEHRTLTGTFHIRNGEFSEAILRGRNPNDVVRIINGQDFCSWYRFGVIRKK